LDERLTALDNRMERYEDEIHHSQRRGVNLSQVAESRISPRTK
jgi:hypothetical protein